MLVYLARASKKSCQDQISRPVVGLHISPGGVEQIGERGTFALEGKGSLRKRSSSCCEHLNELDVLQPMPGLHAFWRALRTSGCRPRSITSSSYSTCFFSEGIAFDKNRFNPTAVTAPLFKYLYLAPGERVDEEW